MTNFPLATALPSVPAEHCAAVEELVAALTRELGTKLVSAMVHGSAVHGTYIAGSSDLDLVLVIASDDPEDLDRMAVPCRLARFRAAIEVMVLHPRELDQALDVFPLLFGDLARHHLLVAGTHPFADPQIHPEHLRLRIEQELRDAEIRLRRIYVDHLDDLPGLARELARKYKQIRSPLAALLRLRGHAGIHLFDPDLYAQAATRYHLDLTALKEPANDPVPAYRQLAQLLRAAIEDVNAPETSGGATR